MSEVPRKVRAGTTGILIAFRAPELRLSGGACGYEEEGASTASWGKPMSGSQVQEDGQEFQKEQLVRKEKKKQVRHHTVPFKKGVVTECCRQSSKKNVNMRITSVLERAFQRRGGEISQLD